MKCEICNKEFNRKDVYDRHLLSNSHKINLIDKKPEIQLYECKICNFECDKQSKYDKHLLTEKHKIKIGNKNKEPTKYECDLCKYETYRRNNFERHKLVHIIKDVKCKICDKKYKTEEQCENHKKSENHLKTCRNEIYKLKGKITNLKKISMTRNRINFREDFKETMYDEDEKEIIKKIKIEIDNVIEERDLYKRLQKTIIIN